VTPCPIVVDFDVLEYPVPHFLSVDQRILYDGFMMASTIIE